MSLDPAAVPSRLYVAVGDEVNPARPLFTGDVFDSVDIPGVGRSAAIIIGHPCSIRGRGGALAAAVPVAAVTAHQEVKAEAWQSGYYNRFPLPGLPFEGGFHVAWLDQFGLAAIGDIRSATRVACLSHPGINQLQQRLVFHQTRLEVKTGLFQQAFDHTYVEADLLEEWATELEELDADPAASFEKWIREGEPSRQDRLEVHQERAPIRREMNLELRDRKGQL